MAEGALPPSALHEPFETRARQRESVVFGVWIFLASEILLFSALFLAYAVYRWTDSAAFAAAARHTNLVFGTVNTALLITSSATIAVAARALPQGRVRLATLCIWATLALGLLFLAVKGLEYHEDLKEGLWPDTAFALPEPAARTFFGLYWLMTGLHACHITAGLLLITRLAWMAHKRVLAERPDSMEATSLYWGLVDAIWIMLFPCLYLVGK